MATAGTTHAGQPYRNRMRHRIGRLWSKLTSYLGLRKLERHELTWLVVGLGSCLLLFAFVALAGEVSEGDTQAFDVRILKALRSSTDPSRPIGPAWIEEALLDLTALGGSMVLGLIVI